MKGARLFRAADFPLWAAGAASFVAAALASAPADLVVDLVEARAPQFKAAATRGTIWKGTFVKASFAGAPIGDIAFAVDQTSFLKGAIGADVSSRDGALVGKATIELAPARIVVKDAAAQFNLAAIRRYTFFGVRYQGAATLKARRLVLSRSGCVADEATLSTDALNALTRQWSGGSFPLSGPIRCEGGKLFVSLAGDGADAAARIDISVAPDLAYTMTVVAEPRRADVQDTLRLFGFESAGRSLIWRTAGRLKGLTS